MSKHQTTFEQRIEAALNLLGIPCPDDLELFRDRNYAHGECSIKGRMFSAALGCVVEGSGESLLREIAQSPYVSRLSQ